ncbi:MAG TPA: hypothetical protein VL426_00415 [Candidatus Binatia bacterium]|jgi:hypothetical protein|nr:hypothetical protein [Candidatus Binatia bacterium]
MSNMPERIELTTDPDRHAKLRRKLEEYAQRMTLQHGPSTMLDLTLKHRLLSALLEDGSVDIIAFQARMESENLFRSDTFKNAVMVIAAYNDDMPAALLGGTGLR